MWRRAAVFLVTVLTALAYLATPATANRDVLARLRCNPRFNRRCFARATASGSVLDKCSCCRATLSCAIADSAAGRKPRRIQRNSRILDRNGCNDPPPPDVADECSVDGGGLVNYALADLQSGVDGSIGTFYGGPTNSLGNKYPAPGSPLPAGIDGFVAIPFPILTQARAGRIWPASGFCDKNGTNCNLPSTPDDGGALICYTIQGGGSDAVNKTVLVVDSCGGTCAPNSVTGPVCSASKSCDDYIQTGTFPLFGQRCSAGQVCAGLYNAYTEEPPPTRTDKTDSGNCAPPTSMPGRLPVSANVQPDWCDGRIMHMDVWNPVDGKNNLGTCDGNGPCSVSYSRVDCPVSVYTDAAGFTKGGPYACQRNPGDTCVNVPL